MKKTIIGVFCSLILCLLLPASASAAGPQDHTSHEDADWIALTQEYIDQNGSKLSGGSYYLAEDLTVTKDITVPNGEDANLCLNGHVLTLQNGSRFLFGGKNPRTFCLCDCQSSKVTYGNIDEETGLWKKSDSPGNCDLNGGVITGGTRSAFWIQNLTLNMYGGNIAGNALGVSINYQATFSLYGGSITGNANSGSVSEDKDNISYGGGVYINQKPLQLSGGADLSGNTGDDLYLRSLEGDPSTAVELTSPLTDGRKISVTMYTPGVVVTNWKDHMGDKDPADYLDMRANPGYHIGINGDGAATLLANIYTVEFHPNGGSSSIYEQRFFYDMPGKLTPNKFTRTGYTFAGWSAGNTTYTDGQEVKNLTAENNGVIILAAQWQANTYNVTLNPNGGSINSGDVTSYTYGTSKELPTDVTRTGYTFQGWYDNESLTGSPATRITAADLGDKVFWAKWQANNYTITLHPNEGKIDGSTPDGDGNYIFQYTYGNSAALPAEKEITRSGYYFGGWYDNEELKGKPVTEITAADLGDKAFWAKWYYISDTSTYSVILPDNVEGGKVTAAKGYAEEGEIVRLTVTPEEGYVLSALTVTRSNGGKLTLTEEGEGVWSFRMPASQVTVEAVFAPSALPFTDVPEGAWYRSAVWYAYTHGLMNGVSDTTFAPGSTTSRAMIVTILWRQAGSPVVNYAMDFDDVSQGQWYSEAIRWAASEGIAGGYGDGSFGTNDPITREQFAAMLYRYAQKQGYDVSVGEETNILSYADAQKISEYAIPAMQWACGAGVIQGDGNALNPQGYATRSEAAAMLMRFCKNMEK